jgi:hypothetical protein
LPITFVGGYTLGYEGTTSNITVTLTSLTGGTASSPSIGDIVVVYYAIGSLTNVTMPTITDYTNIADLYEDDTNDSNLGVYYKILSAADTSFTIVGGTTDAARAGAVAVHVWRNVGSISATTNATDRNGGRPTPPAVTPTVSGSIILAGGGAGTRTNDTRIFTTATLSNFFTSASEDTVCAVVGLGSFTWVSGTYTPAQFGGSTTAGNASWTAATLILIP